MPTILWPPTTPDQPGAGIYNGAGRTLTLNNSTVSDNGIATPTNPGNGGGIYNAGILTVGNNSVISGNLGGDGGGIYNVGSADISNTLIRSNTAGMSGSFPFFAQLVGTGGGVYNAPAATLSLTNTTITANGAGAGGGVANLSNGAAVPLTRGAQAAAIAMTINGGTIANNTATICGGGISNGVASSGPTQADSSLTVIGTTIQNNVATGGTVFIFSSGGLGGGLCNYGTATISQATIATNSAAAIGTQNEIQTGLGGGIGSVGTLTIDHSSLVGNNVSGPGHGGAIANGTISRIQGFIGFAQPSSGPRAASVDTQLTITNSTISGNSAPNGGGALYNVDSSTATLTNITIADNITGVLNDLVHGRGSPRRVRCGRHAVGVCLCHASLGDEPSTHFREAVLGLTQLSTNQAWSRLEATFNCVSPTIKATINLRLLLPHRRLRRRRSPSRTRSSPAIATTTAPARSRMAATTSTARRPAPSARPAVACRTPTRNSPRWRSMPQAPRRPTP